MKILFAITSIILILFGAINPNNTEANYNEWYFIVTAYYSPLPNQEYYYTWNYEDEIKLNWRWTHWASGKEVFSWMLAWPKTYSFGTKIYLEWLGIWEIADRWGAIVKAWVRNNKYDRIDVWVWYWDEGLRRAMNWWKQTVKWYIVHSTQPSTIDYNTISDKELREWVVIKSIITEEVIEEKKEENTKIIASSKNNNKEEKIIEEDIVETIEEEKIWPAMVELNLEIFNKTILNKEEVIILQDIMKEMWLYSGDSTWNMKDITKVIYNYQVKNWLIINRNSWGAGNWWPKTREIFKNEYLEFIKEKEVQDKIKQEEEAKLEEQKRLEAQKESQLIKLEILREKAIIEAQKEVKPITNVIYTETSINVRQLQLLLKELWYFEWQDTAYFWDKTKEALLNFQADNEIIQSKDDTGAWKITKETIEKFEERIQDRILKDMVYELWELDLLELLD